MKEHFYISSTKYTLQERMTKNRGRVYDVVFRIVTLDGTEKQKKLSGYSTKTAAKNAYTEFVTEYCELVKNNPIKKKKIDTSKKEFTVSELIPVYISSLKNQNKDSSIYDKINIFENIIKKDLGEYKISELTTEALYKWQDELWSRKNPRTNDYYSYQYLAKTRAHLSSFLTYCESRYGYKNNLPKVAKPKKRVNKTEMQFWSREEFDKFISVVDDPMYHALFTTLFFTGRRKGEIFALTTEDIKENSITFNKSLTRKTIDGSPYNITSTKADKRGETPICEILKQELAHYKGDRPFFFGGERPLAENTVTRAFDRYIALSGVKRIRMHDLRHSFVSMLIHLGANFMVVADLIGDTIEQVTKTYAHLYEEDKQRIISAIK